MNDTVCEWVADHQDRWLRQAIVPTLYSDVRGEALVLELAGPLWHAAVELRPTSPDIVTYLDNWLRESHPIPDLLHQWNRNWARCDPAAYMLKQAYRERWVRFHSLPESKRYAETEAEYAIILERYNTVLNELFAGEDVYVITGQWRDDPKPQTDYWTTICTDPDPDDPTYWHVYAKRIPWTTGAIDPLLRDVADDVEANVMITDVAMTRIHHPYDGGADVLLPTSEERDVLRARHTEWLSRHPQGL
ncbi:hypothetical protein F4560_006423 [Saccharothrix ecbatanensis]|uniref:DUF3885 domain-containing protein n=1 Tax=Saccharothrix ecbatanensis TaxID=1105145 RepID=A0A7W9HQP5_9PSEU|nr:hypothetical protein [Saccharothrix ecbatanensis]